MRLSSLLAIPVVLAPALFAGDNEPRTESAPIYRVTVIQHSFQAVNYGHRSLPTRLDFRGTVLSSKSHGSAMVEAKPGAVSIHAKFDDLGPAGRFGAQYLTYVLWAVSPDGQTDRLGEIVTNHRDDAKLEVTTSFQAFGLMVTAEPYYAVSKPSPVVVLENVVRPDTVGSTELISAKYSLLPRDENYVLDLNAPPPGANAPLVSQREYEVLLALYQAQNAIQIAQSERADSYASATMQKATQLLQQAEQIPDRKTNSEKIVMLARQAAQTAEDARSIAARQHP
jgi:hypothetical protein